MRIFLVDFENTKSNGITGIDLLNEDDIVYLFYSNNVDSITLEAHMNIVASKGEFHPIKLDKPGKNALDFQLVTYLGYLIGTKDVGEYYIVSRDYGFQHAINFCVKYLSNENVLVKRVESIEAVIVPKNPVKEEVTVTEPVKEIAKDLAVKEIAKDLAVKEIAKDLPIKEIAKDLAVKEIAKDIAVKEIAKDIQVKEITKDLAVKEITKDLPVKEIAKDIPVKEVTKSLPVKKELAVVAKEIIKENKVLPERVVQTENSANAVLSDKAHNNENIEEELEEVRKIIISIYNSTQFEKFGERSVRLFQKAVTKQGFYRSMTKAFGASIGRELYTMLKKEYDHYKIKEETPIS